MVIHSKAGSVIVTVIDIATVDMFELRHLIELIHFTEHPYQFRLAISGVTLVCIQNDEITMPDYSDFAARAIRWQPSSDRVWMKLVERGWKS